MSDPAPAARRASILVVDDTPENLSLLCEMLRASDYRVRPVPSGPLALRAARADPPDLILLDIYMPEMSGFEMCERLKADPELAGIPVMILTGCGASVLSFAARRYLFRFAAWCVIVAGTVSEARSIQSTTVV